MLILANCGHKPIYSSKEFDFSFKKIIKENSKINNEIEKALEAINNKNSTNSFDISFTTKRAKIVKSKDSKGDPNLFELKIIMNVKVTNKNITNQKELVKSISYNNSDNKFELFSMKVN